MKNPAVTANEVAYLLRKILAGQVTVKVEGETWDEVFAGDVTFVLSNGDRIVVFNDCDGLDYIDRVKLADGREAEFEDWTPTDEAWDSGQPVSMNPLDHLQHQHEHERLYRIFKGATA